MLDNFSLIGKRDVLRNTVDWSKHSILTFKKDPTHIVLNINNLLEKDFDQFCALMEEVWEYISPSSS